MLNVIIYPSSLSSLRLSTQINWSALIFIFDPGFTLVVILCLFVPVIPSQLTIWRLLKLLTSKEIKSSYLYFYCIFSVKRGGGPFL